MSGYVEVSRAAGGTLRLAYDAIAPDAAAIGAPPVLLVHGFASSRRTNWRAPSWYRSFAEAGREIIAFDHRGHGESEASHDSDDYATELMARDCVSVLDACGAGEADVFGYSMGAMVAIRLVLDWPERVRRVVLGGLGENYMTPPAFSDAVPAALLADDPASVTDKGALTFRVFADQQGQDRRALAACWRRLRGPARPEELAKVDHEVLVVCGENDAITGSPAGLAALFPHGRAAVVPGRDHMTAVGDKATKAAVLAFLEA